MIEIRKRFCSLIAACTLSLSVLPACVSAANAEQMDFETLSVENRVFAGGNLSAQLKVEGNKVVNAATGELVRLTGVNVPSLEWSSTGEHIYTSVAEACDNWNANVIRLPLSSARWFGLTKEQKGKGAAPYREIVADVVAAAQERGKYVILDCHWSDAGQTEELRKPENINTDLVNNTTAQHKMPDEGVKEFWLDIVKVYGNNPAVLFDLYNEPYSVSWDIWRNGGEVTDKAAGKTVTFRAVGHQELVEAIRDAGAKNVIIAGGLDYAYSLTGIAGKSGSDKTVYALIDQGTGGDISKAGYGIVYDTHIYPWKYNKDKWETAVGCVLDQYPVIVGESGWEKQINETHDLSMQKHLKTNSPYWVNELLNWIDEPTNDKGEKTGVPLNWTVWTFHPNAQPTTFSNWYYEPTPFWGKYVKERLLSYPIAQPEAKNYINNFREETDWIARYIDQNGKTPGNGTIKSRTYEANDTVKITYEGDGAEIRMEPMPQVSFRGIQSLHLTLEPSADGNAEIGITETDGERWTTCVNLKAGEQNKISIPIHELKLTPFAGANGIFTGVAANICIKPSNTSGTMRISNLLINRGGEEMGGYSAFVDTQTQTLEYIYQKDVVMNGQPQTADFFSSLQGTKLLHFLGQGEGSMIVGLTAGAEQYRTEVSFTSSETWSHIRLRSEDFEGLSDFSQVNSIQISGQARGVLRHIAFTNVEPPDYQPNSENKVDYCVNFEDGRDDLYKLEYNPSAFDVSEVRENDNTVLQFTVKSGGDIMFRMNPDGTQTQVNLRDAKTLSFDIKGDGNYANINMGIMGTKLTTRIPIILEDGYWHRITLNLEKTGVYIPQFISGIKFYMSNFTGGTFQIDNIAVTSGDTVIPDEDIVENFDDTVQHFTWNSAAETAGKNGKGYALSLRTEAVTAILDKSSLAFWQRDLSGLRYVSFYAKTDKPDVPVTLMLYDMDEKEIAHYQIRFTAADWQIVSIPLLSGSIAPETGNLAELAWSSQQACTLVIDDLSLSKKKPRVSTDGGMAEVVSDSKLLFHDDFEGEITVERNGNLLEVKEDGVSSWKAVGTAIAIDNLNLFQFTDYFNTSNFLTTATDEQIHIMSYNNNKATLYRDFERPHSEGQTVVEMRIRYSAYGGNEITLYEKSASNLLNNAVVAKVVLDANGNLFYQNEYTGSSSKENTQSQISVQAGDWVYIRAVVNSKLKTVNMYAGRSFEQMKPWCAERSTFNFAANNSKAPYVQAGEGLSSVAVSGKGVASIDDVRVYHAIKNSPPQASSVSIQGIPRTGEVLSASYVYYDGQGIAEGESVGKWESASDKNFTDNVQVVGMPGVVSAETGSVYRVTAADAGKYLRFSVVPRNAAGDYISENEAYCITAKVGAVDVVRAIFTKGGEDASLSGIGVSGTAGSRIFATNTLAESQKLRVYVAVYDGEVLQGVTTETIVIPAETLELLSLDAAEFRVDAASEYKMYIWNDDLTPCGEPVNASRIVSPLKPIVQEFFTAADGTDLASYEADAINGWASGWKTLKKIDNVNTVIDIPENTYVIKNNGMTTVKPQYGGAGGYGFNIFRYLNDDSQIRLNEDGEYFIRYTIPEVQYLVSASHNYQNQTLAFYAGAKSKFSVGVKRKDDLSNYMVFHTNFAGAPLEYKIENKEKYTFVIRISARADGDDVCRIKLFRGAEEADWFPLEWDYEVTSAKNDVIDALAMTLSNHGAPKVYPQYDDIQVMKSSPVYVERRNSIGLIMGEVLQVSVPEKNVYGNPQILKEVEWFLVKDGEHKLAGTGAEFTVPTKSAADFIRARVTTVDQITGKSAAIWAVSDRIV